MGYGFLFEEWRVKIYIFCVCGCSYIMFGKLKWERKYRLYKEMYFLKLLFIKAAETVFWKVVN